MSVKFLFPLLVLLSFHYYGQAKLFGRIMAFVDINADCFTDLLVSDGPNSITVYVASEKEPEFKEDDRFRHRFPEGSSVLNIGVGDFDGDSFPDIVVSLSPDSSSAQYCDKAQQLQICYGLTDGFHCYNMSYLSNETTPNIFCEQPLVLDCNADEHSDLLTTIRTDSGTIQFACLLGNDERPVFKLISPFPPSDETDSKPLVPTTRPSFNAFVDVTGDLNAELVLWTTPTSTNDLIGLTVFQRVAKDRWDRMDNFMSSPPTASKRKLLWASSSVDSAVLGQSVYDDFNKDGTVDHLLPYCDPDSSGRCGSINLALWIGGNWASPVILDLLDDKGTQWSVLTEQVGAKDKKLGTFLLRSGDYTRDGYPDLLIVLQQSAQSKDGMKREVFLLENVPCAAGQVCGEWKRTFRIWWKPFRGASDQFAGSVTTATFFDLGEDGTLDILLEYDNYTNGGPYFIDFSSSAYEGDTTFLKVQVFTSTCLDDCRYDREGSAISLPGASLVYTSSDTDGNPIRGAYTQRPVTGYRSLSLPYALFGLGRTPNFVEKLHVGAPSWPARNKSWEQLVPNSRIYVIPHPLEQPKQWVHRLYLTPNKLIVYSFISLSSVCGIIIVLVFALHMQERRLDKKERELQRERFHFDAM